MEYTYFVKVGQPKLSERKSQTGGLVVTPTKLVLGNSRKVEDYGLKESVTTEFSSEREDG